MDDPHSTTVILIIFLLFLSAFLSAAETALVSLSRLRLRHMSDEGVRGAEALERLVGKNNYLTSILIGNNFVNIFITSLATTAVNKITGGTGAALVLTTAAVTVVILVFGEITPKSLGARYAERVSLLVTRPIKVLNILFTPISIPLNGLARLLIRRMDDGRETSPSITESEIRSMVDVGLEEGVLDDREQELIHNVFTFGDSDAAAIMTPRTEIVALPASASYDEAARVFREEGFSRVPVYKNDIDHIIGILHFKDFFLSDKNPEDFNPEARMREPFFSYETKKTLSLLTEMRQQNASLAVILDEYGGTAGIVSLEDLIEMLVGEIYDEYDEADDEILRVSENTYRVGGGVKLIDFNQRAGTRLSSDDYETVGGYVMGLLGSIPQKGATAVDGDMTFVVEEVVGRRAGKLTVMINDDEEEQE